MRPGKCCRMWEKEARMMFWSGLVRLQEEVRVEMSLIIPLPD